MWRAKADDLSDEALVRSVVRSRDERSFRALYRRHSAVMLRVARRAAGQDGGSVDDVLQEAWVRAVRSLPSFEWRSTLSSWLCGIVINVARESRRAHRPAQQSDPANGDVEAAALWVDPVDAMTLSEALESLPDGYRSVVALHDIAGFTHEEIGVILSIDAGTSKSQLSRARQKLRDLLRQGQGDKS